MKQKLGLDSVLNLPEMILARKLQSVVIRRGKTNRGINLAEWSEHLRKLMERDGHSFEMIASMIDWYGNHHHAPFMPDIRSGRSFRSKFRSLLQAKKREVTNPSPIQKEVSKLSDRLRLIWPNDEKKEELEWMQLSWDHLTAYAIFLHRKSKMIPPETHRVADLQRRFKRERLLSFFWKHLRKNNKMSILEEHALSICRMSHEWSEWPGTLKGFHLHAESRFFERFVKGSIPVDHTRWIQIRESLACVSIEEELRTNASS